MLISDVIKVLGDSSLGDFPWGVAVADTINLFTPDERRLSTASNGADVEKAIESLDADTRALIMRARIDPRKGVVKQPMGGGMEVEHSIDADPSGELIKSMMTPPFIFTIFLVTGVVATAIFMLKSLVGKSPIDWGALLTAIYHAFK